MDPSDNGSRRRLDEPNKVFENALKMLENENIGKLAKIIFTVDNPWLNDIVNKFNKAHDGFIECWRENHHIEFNRGFDALQLAFFCDILRQLLINKNLSQLRIEEYLGFVLPKLFNNIREGNIEYYEEMRNYAIIMLRFDNRQTDIIVQNLFAQCECKTAKLDNEDIVKWLTNVRESSMQQPLTITSNSMIMAATIIKEIYRDRFARYNPFYFDLGFQFDMNSWIPIKLIAKNDGDGREKDDDESEGDGDDDARKENDSFQLIENGLKRNANELKVGSLVVITGK
jgi:hypothetical protein